VEEIVGLKSCPEWGRGIIPLAGDLLRPIRGENPSKEKSFPRVPQRAAAPRCCSTRGYRPTPLPGLMRESIPRLRIGLVH
jgi:hypothetical protein